MSPGGLMQDGVVRAGLLKRTGALLVDLMLAAFVVQAAAAVAFSLTGGRVQSLEGLIRFDSCLPVKQLPSGLTLPPGFRLDSLTACTRRLIAFPTSRTLTADEVTRSGNATTIRRMTWSLDAEGRVVAATRLDSLLGPLMIVLRLLFDLFGRSPGRRLCRQWLVPADDAADAHGPAARGRIVRRYAYFGLAVVPSFVADLAFPGAAGGLAVLLRVVLAGIAICAVVIAALAIAFGRDAFYDRAAGTHVVPG